MLGRSLRPEVHALEHKPAQREHRLADVRALPDFSGIRRRLDQVVDEPVDPARPGRAEQLDLGAREFVLGKDARPKGVVDVVVDVGDAVDEPDDSALERPRLVRPSVVEDPVAHLFGEVETAAISFEDVDDPERVLVVAEPEPEPLTEDGVERLLPGVAEGRVPEVVTEADRLDEIFVQV